MTVYLNIHIVCSSHIKTVQDSRHESEIKSDLTVSSKEYPDKELWDSPLIAGILVGNEIVLAFFRSHSIPLPSP